MIKLIPLDLEHRNELFLAIGKKEVWENVLSNVSTMDDMERIIVRAINNREDGREIPYVIKDSENKVVGTTRIGEINNIHKCCEIGWTWLAPEVWGTGVNLYVKYLLLKQAFEDMGMKRVQFCIHERNVRSRKAVEQMGAIKEGFLRNRFIWPDGKNEGQFIYSIVSNDWEEVKRSMEEKLQ